MMEERIIALEAATREILARMVGHVPDLPKPDEPAAPVAAKTDDEGGWTLPPNPLAKENANAPAKNDD